MIETTRVTLWSLSDEKIFLNQVIDRCRGKSATADRFGTSTYFIEQYLAGLALRTVNFTGTGNLEAFERAAIKEYARELIQAAVPIAG